MRGRPSTSDGRMRISRSSELQEDSMSSTFSTPGGRDRRRPRSRQSSRSSSRCGTGPQASRREKTPFDQQSKATDRLFRTGARNRSHSIRFQNTLPVLVNPNGNHFKPFATLNIIDTPPRPTKHAFQREARNKQFMSVRLPFSIFTPSATDACFVRAHSIIRTSN
jgi:hypothetical protein